MAARIVVGSVWSCLVGIVARPCPIPSSSSCLGLGYSFSCPVPFPSSFLLVRVYRSVAEPLNECFYPSRLSLLIICTVHTSPAFNPNLLITYHHLRRTRCVGMYMWRPPQSRLNRTALHACGLSTSPSSSTMGTRYLTQRSHRDGKSALSAPQRNGCRSWKESANRLWPSLLAN